MGRAAAKRDGEIPTGHDGQRIRFNPRRLCWPHRHTANVVNDYPFETRTTPQKLKFTLWAEDLLESIV